ncbi:hypothetical protein AWV63_15385 [Micromonospora rifamycinica]|uniref:Tetratricopeptide repeat-containing protein n=1 Tax=Micromonospora rifamycinica TaxID=291594 RepID=A0A109IJT6_9ACTN|nr:hypothetical protein AWV63_15385 [Micromonospora rifamycinica]SCG45928.1 Tetratricopeptide repeat-containing protein [Micromonospora rifamycinica]
MIPGRWWRPAPRNPPHQAITDRTDPFLPTGYVVSHTGPVWAEPFSVGISGYFHGNVFIGSPAYRLTGAGGGVPRAVESLRLSELLDPRHRVVPFVGREDEQRSLWRWLDPPHAGLRSVRLMYAPGGQGKTRLADRVGATAQEAGWTVLHASCEPLTPEPRSGPSGGSDNDGALLVVVDYADRWPAGALPSLLTDPLLHGGGQVRVLLLARSPGYWWAGLRSWLTGVGMPADEFPLPPLAADPQARRRLFRVAVDRFASLLPDARPAEVVVPRLTDPAYGTALAVQLAALVAVDVSRLAGSTAPSSLVDLYGHLIGRETAHWQKLRRAGVTTSPTQQLDLAVVTATLAGPVADDAAGEILRCAGAEPTTIRALLTDHTACYPSYDQESVLEPLRPDRWGEAYLALAVAGHDWWSRHPPRSWAAGVARALLRAADLEPATAAGVRARALTVLSEVATEWRHVATRVLLPALRADPALATAAGGAVLATIVDLPDMDVELLAAIEPHLPPGRHSDFDLVARRITGRLVEYRLPRCGDDAERARLHIDYGRRLARAGDRHAAQAALDRAVAAAEAARAADPGPTTAVLLAWALHLRGHRLAAVNRSAEALASVERAVEILDFLAGDDPAYRFRLAETLDNLGIRLAEVGRHPEAEVAARRSVKLFSADAPSPAGEVGRAAALTNLSAIKAHQGRADSALRTARRAARLWRRLSDEQPAVYLPELALTLNTLGLRYAESGRLEEAVKATAESEEIYRELVDCNPVVFELDLAAVLANLSGHLWRLNRRAEALRTHAEAERIFTRWGGADPEVFSPHLREVRQNLARMVAEQTPVYLYRWEPGAGSFGS